MANEILYEEKQCLRFNDSLDEDGKIEIAGYSEFPSRILYDMDFEAYKEALNEFLERELEKLKKDIHNYCPSCVAYNLRLSERGDGATDPVKKLLHLKDTWEAVTFVLSAIVWGEIRHKGINLKTCQVLQNDDLTNPQYVSFGSKLLLTDAIKTKVKCIRAIIDFSKTHTLGLKCEAISEELLNKLLSLQDVRNDISHHQAPTKEQAEAELQIVEPIFSEMLNEIRFLLNPKILRFESYTSKCKCEVFNGHSLNKEYEEFDFGANTAYVLGLGQEQIFTEWDGEVFSLSPFLHFMRDTTGHESYLAFFKGKKDGKFQFEPVKVRDEKTFDSLETRFESEKDVLVNLIKP